MGREEQRLHPREHGHLGRFDARLAQPPLDGVDERPRARVGRVRLHGERGVVGDDVGAGADVLGHAHVVVGQQRAGRLGDRGRAAVVDLEGVLRRAGEVAPVVDEEPRISADVPVDALVVVADPEHVGRGTRGQADEQHMGRGEVLQLVDEEMAVIGLHGAPQRAVVQQRLERAEDLLVEVDQLPGGAGRRGTARRRRPGR